MKRNSSPGFYDGKNDVTCRKTGGKQQSRPHSLGKCGKTTREEKGGGGGERVREKEQEKERGKDEGAGGREKHTTHL